MDSLLVYVIGVNFISFIFMGIDKQKARNGAWRIPERTFWALAIIGGAIGSFIGMRIFHHKTKHRSFTIGMPVIIVIHLLIIGYAYLSLS